MQVDMQVDDKVQASLRMADVGPETLPPEDCTALECMLSPMFTHEKGKEN